MFDFANITNATSMLQIIVAINRDWTGGMFAILMIFSLFIIIYMNISYFSAANALMATSFYMSVIVGLMWLAGLVPFYVFVIAEAILYVGVLLSLLMDR